MMDSSDHTKSKMIRVCVLIVDEDYIQMISGTPDMGLDRQHFKFRPWHGLWSLLPSATPPWITRVKKNCLPSPI